MAEPLKMVGHDLPEARHVSALPTVQIDAQRMVGGAQAADPHRQFDAARSRREFDGELVRPVLASCCR